MLDVKVNNSTLDDDKVRFSNSKTNPRGLVLPSSDGRGYRAVVSIAGHRVSGLVQLGKLRLRAHYPFGSLFAGPLIPSPAQSWGACVAST
jgi:hypothetical protein